MSNAIKVLPYFTAIWLLHWATGRWQIYMGTQMDKLIW